MDAVFRRSGRCRGADIFCRQRVRTPGPPDDRFRVVGFPESFVVNNRVFVEIFLHL